MTQVITIAGERLFALKAQNNQQLDIDTFIFAFVPGQDSSAPIDRNEGLPPIGQRVHTQIVQQTGLINENAVVYSSVLDSLTGPFDFNWVGLYSSVNQTLIAIIHTPTVSKTVTVPGAAGNILNRNFVIEYSGIAELTGITVDPETWQLDYTARLNGMDELTRQLAADMNGKDWFIEDGFKVVPRSTLNTFKVTAGAGYVSGLRVELAADHILTLSSYPQFVYVDAWFDGTSESIWKGHTAFTVTNTEMDDYIDVNGRNHYVFKLARITAADAVEDLRNINGLNKKIESHVNNLDGGHDSIYYRAVTMAQLANIKTVGITVSVIERGKYLFKTESGGEANNIDLLPAGDGNTARLISKTNNILAYGGIDDFNGTTGTNNKPVIDYLIYKRPITVKMPKTKTGVYLYDGTPSSTAADLSGLTLEVDEGVSIRSTGLTNGPFWRKGVKINRELKSYVEGARYNLYSSPEQYKKPSEQFSKLTHADGNIDQIRLIDFSSTDVRCYELSNWPAGTLNVISPTSATQSDLNLGTIPTSSFKMAGIPVAPRDFIQAHVVAGTVRPCVFVQTDTGYVIVQQNPTVASTVQVQIYENLVAKSYDITDQIFAQPEYKFTNASLGIIIYNHKSFGVVLNGIVIKRINTSGGIQIAGWGAGFGTNNLTINRPSAFYNKKSIGIKNLKIIGVGDSTSANTLPPSQLQYLKQYLAGSCGAEVFQLTNLAVGGQTSSQQKTTLLSTDIVGYDYCLIQIGVNDIQTVVPALTYAQNVIDMIDYCELNNVVPIVGLPTGWYSQANAQVFGQDGQNTSNSTKVGQYRDVLMHALGAKGGVLMNHSVVEDTGTILADWLSIAGADPKVQDNIHPTALNQMAIGMSYAKAIIGHLMDFRPTSSGVYMPKYWFNSGVGAGQTPRITVSNNVVNIEWFFTRDGATLTDGLTVATLPNRFRPKKSFYVAAISTTSDSNVLAPTKPIGQIQIRDDGAIKIYNIDPAAYYVSFNASWMID